MFFSFFFFFNPIASPIIHSIGNSLFPIVLKKRLCVRLVEDSDDKHNLRKSADRKQKSVRLSFSNCWLANQFPEEGLRTQDVETLISNKIGIVVVYVVVVVVVVGVVVVVVVVVVLVVIAVVVVVVLVDLVFPFSPSLLTVLMCRIVQPNTFTETRCHIIGWLVDMANALTLFSLTVLSLATLVHEGELIYLSSLCFIDKIQTPVTPGWFLEYAGVWAECTQLQVSLLDLKGFALMTEKSRLLSPMENYGNVSSFGNPRWDRFEGDLLECGGWGWGRFTLPPAVQVNCLTQQWTINSRPWLKYSRQFLCKTVWAWNSGR